MDISERQWRHDERWQHEMLDGMARVLDVLHDISAAVRQLAENAKRPAPPPPAPMPSERPQPLLSVDAVAEMLGVTPNVIRSLRASGKAPPATRLGSRVFFHRNDVDAWLRERRETPAGTTRPWRGSFLPGRIGSNVPASTRLTRRPLAGIITASVAVGPRWSHPSGNGVVPWDWQATRADGGIEVGRTRCVSRVSRRRAREPGWPSAKALPPVLVTHRRLNRGAASVPKRRLANCLTPGGGVFLDNPRKHQITSSERGLT